MKRITLFILSLLLMASCKDSIVKTELFDDGTVKSERFYKKVKDKEELIKEVTYHTNGKKYTEGTYKNGLKDGHWVSWYDNGAKWSEGDFKDGESQGIRKVYHPNGTLHYEGEFDKDDRVGIWRFFDDQGNLEKETDYGKPAQPGN